MTAIASGAESLKRYLSSVRRRARRTCSRTMRRLAKRARRMGLPVAALLESHVGHILAGRARSDHFAEWAEWDRRKAAMAAKMGDREERDCRRRSAFFMARAAHAVAKLESVYAATGGT